MGVFMLEDCCFFGLAGMIAVYIIEPWMRSRIVRIRPQIKVILVTFLVIAFCMDTFVALQSPNLGIEYRLRG